MASANRIPEPRVYARAESAWLLDEAARIAARAPATRHEESFEIRARIADSLSRNDEFSVRAALAMPGSRAAGSVLFDAVERTLAPPPRAVGVQTRLFAIPVLIVTGGGARATIPGVVPDVAEIASVFEKAGALGHARNFGFSNAMSAPESLEAVSWTRLYRTAIGETQENVGELDLPPAEIVCDPRKETVHLRFLAGAMLTPAEAPGFVETAADIGLWGMAFTQALGKQLAAADMSLLPIPRPPAGFLRAARVGRFAASELGLQLFLSNALRQARTRTGDPDVTIASYSDATVRVHLTSVFDDLLDQTYAWQLSPLDDLNDVADSIFSLLAECRLDRVEVVDKILPSLKAKN